MNEHLGSVSWILAGGAQQEPVDLHSSWVCGHSLCAALTPSRAQKACCETRQNDVSRSLGFFRNSPLNLCA